MVLGDGLWCWDFWLALGGLGVYAGGVGVFGVGLVACPYLGFWVS